MDIPIGFCQCGCGQKTRIAPYNSTEKGWIKGQPIRFVSGHNARIPDTPIVPPNPSGLCQCGCGQKTPLANRTSAINGWIRGQPIRVVPGHHPRKPAAQRFWARVDKRGPDECWEWQGVRLPKGYGNFSVGQKRIYAHRFAYELTHGPTPEGMEVLHTCDNPPCCNPAHLYAGTQKDNTRDMIERGRMNPPRGMRNGHAKLTDDAVREIRRLYVTGGIAYPRLAAMFGVSTSAIGAVVTQKSWAHVK